MPFGWRLSPSIKAGLDIDWSDPRQKATAIQIVERQVESLVRWVERHLDDVVEAPLQSLLDAVTTVREQDLEKADGVVRIRQGVAKDRRISIEDAEMRHGRKSRSKRFDGRTSKCAFALPPMQGGHQNRLNSASENLFKVFDIPCSLRPFGRDAALQGRLSLEHHHGYAPQGPKVLRTGFITNGARVFSHLHIENPMQPVLNLPMLSGRSCNSTHVGGKARQVIVPFGRPLFSDYTSSLDQGNAP
jgi:hypothetical protein